MAVKIRLTRVGKKHLPIFRIVAVDSKAKRDGAYLENLGTYDAVKSEFVQFKPERIDAWKEKGAIVSDAVKKLYRTYKRADGTQKA